MAGLVTYASSDEENQEQAKAPPRHAPTQRLLGSIRNGIKGSTPAKEATLIGLRDSLMGPVLGPTMEPQMANDLPITETDTIKDGNSTPPSPYSANRALLRNLTLPSVPSYDIPPSPPSTPRESTNAKFKHFLKLKRQGVHFNEKLAKSSAMKNPGLFQKLMAFSDIDELDQYATTLSKAVWDPRAAPDHAFKEELAKSQLKILMAKEDDATSGQRGAVDFVPSTLVGESSKTSSAGAGKGASQKSTAERIMAGLSNKESSSTNIQGVKRKSRFGPDPNT